jgi:chaperonin GroEL
MKAQIEKTTSDYDREKLEERLAKMSGGVAVIYCGAASELEMNEKKDRIEDALHATKAAVEEGIVVGGGVALLRAIESLDDVNTGIDDQNIGVAILRKALEAPLGQIAANAGKDASVVVQKVREGKDDFGFNAKSETYESLFNAGVIDPTKVVRVALENGASIAGMILTTDCVVYEMPEKKKTAMPAMPSEDMY